MALPIQGFNCTFGMAASMRLNEKAGDHSRSTAQSLWFVAQSTGALAGLATMALIVPGRGVDAGEWQVVWLVPSAIAVVATALALGTVRRERQGMSAE
jgi:MFS family permease